MAAFPHVFLNRLDYEHLCLRPTEHVRSTSQLLLLVTYQITAHDDSQKGTEKPTGPPAYTPVANQMYNWTKCGNKGVWGRPVICSHVAPNVYQRVEEGGGSEAWSRDTACGMPTKALPVADAAAAWGLSAGGDATTL